MNPRRQAAILQQCRTHHLASNADAYAFFNLLTGPELFDQVESLLPEHRKRLFPPTETLSMFMAQINGVRVIDLCGINYSDPIDSPQGQAFEWDVQLSWGKSDRESGS